MSSVVMSSVNAQTKQCCSCIKEYPDASYSSAQLKRKGKRMCKQCVQSKEEATTTIPHETASSNSNSAPNSGSAHRSTLLHKQQSFSCDCQGIKAVSKAKAKRVCSRCSYSYCSISCLKDHPCEAIQTTPKERIAIEDQLTEKDVILFLTQTLYQKECRELPQAHMKDLVAIFVWAFGWYGADPTTNAWWCKMDKRSVDNARHLINATLMLVECCNAPILKQSMYDTWRDCNPAVPALIPTIRLDNKGLFESNRFFHKLLVLILHYLKSVPKSMHPIECTECILEEDVGMIFITSRPHFLKDTRLIQKHALGYMRFNCSGVSTLIPTSSISHEAIQPHSMAHHITQSQYMLFETMTSQSSRSFVVDLCSQPPCIVSDMGIVINQTGRGTQYMYLTYGNHLYCDHDDTQMLLFRTSASRYASTDTSCLLEADLSFEEQAKIAHVIQERMCNGDRYNMMNTVKTALGVDFPLDTGFMFIPFPETEFDISILEALVMEELQTLVRAEDEYSSVALLLQSIEMASELSSDALISEAHHRLVRSHFNAQHVCDSPVGFKSQQRLKDSEIRVETEEQSEETWHTHSPSCATLHKHDNENDKSNLKTKNSVALQTALEQISVLKSECRLKYRHLLSIIKSVVRSLPAAQKVSTTVNQRGSHHTWHFDGLRSMTLVEKHGGRTSDGLVSVGTRTCLYKEMHNFINYAFEIKSASSSFSSSAPQSSSSISPDTH